MLTVLLKLKDPLIYINNNITNKEYKDLFFKSIDWFILSQIKKTFKVFYSPSIKLQGKIYIIIS